MRYDWDNVIFRIVNSFLLAGFMGMLEIYQMVLEIVIRMAFCRPFFVMQHYILGQNELITVAAKIEVDQDELQEKVTKHN